MCWYQVPPLKTGADRNSLGEKEVYVVEQRIIKFLARDGGQSEPKPLSNCRLSSEKISFQRREYLCGMRNAL